MAKNTSSIPTSFWSLLTALMMLVALPCKAQTTELNTTSMHFNNSVDNIYSTIHAHTPVLQEQRHISIQPVSSNTAANSDLNTASLSAQDLVGDDFESSIIIDDTDILYQEVVVEADSYPTLDSMQDAIQPEAKLSEEVGAGKHASDIIEPQFPTESSRPVDVSTTNATSNSPTPDISSISTPSNATKSAATPVPSVVERSAFPAEVISLPPRPTRNPRDVLLERARQNSQRLPTATATIHQDGSQIPAFNRLMNLGIEQLRQGDLVAAESSFTQAQRMAPHSASVYYYLGQVAIKRNQPRQAEAMARRGLLVTEQIPTKRALWRIILLAGQMQGNTMTIAEAQQALR